MTDQKTKKIELTSINFKVGKKDINLTMEEAKKFKGILGELFCEKVITREVHYDRSRWWLDSGARINQNSFEVTCDNSIGCASASIGNDLLISNGTDTACLNVTVE